MDTDEILVYVENMINSYRIGLLDFTQNLKEAIQKVYLSEDELNTIVNRYNQLILEFSKELNQHGVHKFSGDQLLISMERTNDYERKSDESQENRKL